MQENKKIPNWLFDYFKQQPKGSARQAKTKVINECVHKDEHGNWQLVLDEPRFEDIMSQLSNFSLYFK